MYETKSHLTDDLTWRLNSRNFIYVAAFQKIIIYVGGQRGKKSPWTCVCITMQGFIVYFELPHMAEPHKSEPAPGRGPSGAQTMSVSKFFMN